jgi:excisionase family DNA binding protein
VSVRLDTTLPEEAVEAIARRVLELMADGENVSEGYVDVNGAAEFLACPTSRIYALVSARRIPFEKDGSRTLFWKPALREWVRGGGGRRP